MHILRTSSMLVRLVLVWFGLTLGAASASPLIAPLTMALVCSEGGSKFVIVDAEGAAVHGARHTLDCPLCLPAAPAPSFEAPRLPAPQAAGCPAPILVQGHIPTTSGAPLPPRGPPRLR
jgi:hypothetical protein